MKKEDIEKYVADLMPPILAGTALQCVDVEYVREKEWYLRIFIDKPGGIEIDDCQMVSEKLAEILDKSNRIPDKYNLEVSSPGIDRPLRKDSDFTDNYGKKIDIHFFGPWNGLKEVTGILEGHDAENITFRKIIKGKVFKQPDVVARKLIASIRPHLDF